MVSSTSGLNERFVSNAKLWNPKEGLELKASDLIIIRDNEELWKINTNILVQELFDAIIENGFLLIVFKYIYTDQKFIEFIERQLYYSNLELEKRINDFIIKSIDFGFELISTKCDSIASKSLLSENR